VYERSVIKPVTLLSISRGGSATDSRGGEGEDQRDLSQKKKKVNIYIDNQKGEERNLGHKSVLIRVEAVRGVTPENEKKSLSRRPEYAA